MIFFKYLSLEITSANYENGISNEAEINILVWVINT